ncbi:FAD-binding oxidoreductase [Congregibacter litoralis]|uniref:FAD/FMN-containing dehydrogenase n=1 Tax=Congregibacter litoralis KT71 TaxID=314285 RepID=A4ADA5_9GAMM|nr:FAD-binding oxidoreductase [Congregibacter litoralis]EAQ96029.1 FAD/FMN-containing dehydrogenase [Congregibacter litoralis KT71]
MTLISELTTLLGAGGVLTGTDVTSRAAGVWRADPLDALAIARPRSTSEVAGVLKLCHAEGVSVVTQGGLTGLVHGADATPEQLILSLERMRSIESIDPIQRTATVEAGVTLQALQEAAEEHQLAFPLDLGARGTATVGGNAATNAGGNRVIRYGMMRDMVLGVEAVLADGTVVSSMNHLIKNNAGYDLKQLFLGSEGTLGVITRLVLRLREAPSSQNVAFVAFADFPSVPRMLKRVDRELGGALSAYEVLWKNFYRLVTEAPASNQPPLAADYPYYALIEAQGNNDKIDKQRFEEVLEGALEDGDIVDAVIAQSSTERQKLWSIRDDVEQTFRYGPPVVFDVSLPIAAMETYVAKISAALDEQLDKAICWVFGHLGDGNLHIIVQTEAGDAPQSRETIERTIYGPLEKIGGSVSAEHGIGFEKKPYLHLSRSATEIGLMQNLKAALDPQGILNPGKIIDAPQSALR